MPKKKKEEELDVPVEVGPDDEEEAAEIEGETEDEIEEAGDNEPTEEAESTEPDYGDETRKEVEGGDDMEMATAEVEVEGAESPPKTPGTIVTCQRCGSRWDKNNLTITKETETEITFACPICRELSVAKK